MRKSERMIIEVTQEEQNKRLVTRQTQGPFQSWESIQEFQINVDGDSNTTTRVNPTRDYESPTTGKMANFLSGSQTKNKIREAIGQPAQTVKQRLESN